MKPITTPCESPGPRCPAIRVNHGDLLPRTASNRPYLECLEAAFEEAFLVAFRIADGRSV